MGRMTEITQGYGDAATFPTWAKHPELDVSSDETELFFFRTKIGSGDKEVEVIAKVYEDGQCEELVAVNSMAFGDLDISEYLTVDQLDDLCKLAETKFHVRAEEDAA